MSPVKSLLIPAALAFFWWLLKVMPRKQKQ